MMREKDKKCQKAIFLLSPCGNFNRRMIFKSKISPLDKYSKIDFLTAVLKSVFANVTACHVLIVLNYLCLKIQNPLSIFYLQKSFTGSQKENFH